MLACFPSPDASHVPSLDAIHTMKGGLRAIMFTDGPQLRMQPCSSTLWDTALNTSLLRDLNVPSSSQTVQRAVDYLLAREIQDFPELRKRNPDIWGSAWGFEDVNIYYPDVDDTCATLDAIRDIPGPAEESYRRGVDWVYAMQNSDGGFVAFDRDCQSPFIEAIPFNDMRRAMIDPSSADMTGRTLSFIARLPQEPRRDAAIERALEWLDANQTGCGAWFGRWGMSYIYGVWAALIGYGSVGLREDDETLPETRHAALFSEFDAALLNKHASLDSLEAAAQDETLGGKGPDADLCARAGDVMACFHALPPAQRKAIVPSVQEMGRGMGTFARAIRSDNSPDEHPVGLADLEELERYCYVVAGTVGELLERLFIDDLTEAHALVGKPSKLPARDEYHRWLAVSFGLGLQLVNILKDASQDFAQGRCFLPRREAKELGLDLSRLLDEDMRPAGRALFEFIAARASQHLDDAVRYVLWWPREAGHIRLFCSVPLLLARASLDELLTSDDSLRFDRTPKISRSRVHQIFKNVAMTVDNDAALEKLLTSPISASPSVSSRTFVRDKAVSSDLAD